MGLADVLDVADYTSSATVYVAGTEAVPAVRAWAEQAAPPGWEHRSAWASDRSPTVTLRHVDGTRTVRVSVAEQWTGAQLGADDTHAVITALRSAIEDRWRVEGGTLLLSPATTGRDLMARCLPRDWEMPVLADDIAEELRAHSGQHRLQITMPPGTEVGQMVEMDMRLAYAAVTWGLPATTPVRRMGEPDQARGRWRGLCRWQVPHGWTGPGLLPWRDPSGVWDWPSRPGRDGRSWLDGAEVDLARRWGWRVDVEECIEWPAGPDPLRTWTDRLVALHQGVRDLDLTEAVADGVRAGTRSILLHAIGALHGTGQIVSHVTPIEQAREVPADALSQTISDDGASIVWTSRGRPAWPEMTRPEWTSCIWARTRCRLMDAPGARHRGKPTRVGALHLPPHAPLIGTRGDALYVAGDPAWPDDGQVGRYRAKAAHGPLVVPATLAELDDIRRRPPAPAADFDAAWARGVERARAALEAARGGGPGAGTGDETR